MRVTIFDGVGLRRLFNGVCGALESYRALNQSRAQTEVARRELVSLQAQEVRDRIAAAADLYSHATRFGEWLSSLLVEDQVKQPPN
jgi:hypothetical protein